MSILSKILGAKKAADEHRKALAAISASHPKPEDAKPYHHTPAHAASDSMNLGASLPTPDLDERIKQQNRRHSRVHLKRTGSDTYLEHRSSLAAKRSTRELAMIAAMQEGNGMDKMKGQAALPTSPRYPQPIYLALNNNPYLIQPPSSLKSRSPAFSTAPSIRRARSPLAKSIAEEPGGTPRPVKHMESPEPARKSASSCSSDGYFLIQS